MADLRDMLQASTQILQGYLAAEEKKKEKEKLENTRKKMEEAMNSGDYSFGLDSNGVMTLKSRSPEEKLKNQIIAEAWKKYQAGDRSPEILKALGMFTPPPKPTTQPVIDPVTGQTLYERPVGSTFQPQQAQINVNTPNAADVNALKPSMTMPFMGDRNAISQYQQARDKLANKILGQKGTPIATPQAPKGAVYYSPSQKKYYDAQGNEVK
jgi:hypothetical protein